MWQEIILNVFCAICGLAALGVAAAAVISGQIAAEGIDGLFLVMVCLLIALLFFGDPAAGRPQGSAEGVAEPESPETGRYQGAEAATARKVPGGELMASRTARQRPVAAARRCC